jgi:hypothetical protein
MPDIEGQKAFLCFLQSGANGTFSFWHISLFGSEQFRPARIPPLEHLVVIGHMNWEFLSMCKRFSLWLPEDGQSWPELPCSQKVV